jgi:hypothetical protein
MSKCVSCGEDVPEGRIACNKCLNDISTKHLREEKVNAEILKASGTGITVGKIKTNVQMHFSDDPYSTDMVIYYYRKKPLNKFQIWMYKVCFGIRAENF